MSQQPQSMSIYNMLLKRQSQQFDINEISKLVIIIKHGIPNDKVKMELFLKLSLLFIKAINNFQSLIVNVPKDKILHENEDIACECYLVFDRCVMNLKMKDLGKFPFYLNTSLNRAIYRVYERNYKKHFSVCSNHDQNSDDYSEELSERRKINFSEIHGYNHHFDLTEIELSSLTDLERSYVDSKLKEEKIDKFLSTHNINKIQYYELSDSVRHKLEKIYSRK